MLWQPPPLAFCHTIPSLFARCNSEPLRADHLPERPGASAASEMHQAHVSPPRSGCLCNWEHDTRAEGLMLVILRYADELRKPESYFDNLKAECQECAVKLAVNLIEDQSGKLTRRRCR